MNTFYSASRNKVKKSPKIILKSVKST